MRLIQNCEDQMQRQTPHERKVAGPTERTTQNDIFELGASDCGFDTPEMRHVVERHTDLGRFEQ